MTNIKKYGMIQWRGIGTQVYYHSSIDYSEPDRHYAFQIPYIIDISTPFIFLGTDSGQATLTCGLEMNDESSHSFKVWVNSYNTPPFNIFYWLMVIGSV